ncbi:hypothetical protein DFH06DRAFT_1302892 [Mycena polygramma]|nr:hypothetical protein DFH06DRAFT_1302892 [Mycena polygramma]
MADDEAHGDDTTKQSTNVRRSLSLLGKINRLDLTTLIRSSSLTSRRVPASLEGSPRRSRKVDLDYVTHEMLDDMAKERKPEGILNLLSHSRSRSGSRSKGGEEADHAADSAVHLVPELPANPQPDPSHKPPQLLQSRPISAATTNTASTVTPANVTPRKRVPSRIPIASVKEVKEEPVETKQVAKKNFSIFGIPMPSPRKSSFGSRPTSPSGKRSPARKASPSPRRAAAASPTPKSKLDKSKPKPNIGEGPPPSSKLDNFSKFFVGTGMRVSSNPERPRPVSPTRTPSKIPTLSQQHSRPTLKQPHSPMSQKPAAPHISPSTIVVEHTTPKAASKVSRKYMSEVGNTARAHEPVTPTHAPRVPSGSMSSIGASTPRARVSGASVVGSTSAPRVRSSISNPRGSTVGARTSATVSTVATPRVRANSAGATQLAAGVTPRVSAATITSTSSISTRERRQSTDSSSHAYRAYNGVRLGGIEEWRGNEIDGDNNIANSRMGNVTGKHVTAQTVGTPTTTAFAMTATAPKSSSAIGAGSTRKHGSFDFERPGWGVRGVGASTSLGVGSRTRRDRETNSRGASVDRGTGAGMAGVGAARLYASTSGAHRTVRVVPPPPPTPPAVEPNHTGASTSSTSHSNANAPSGTSSWGRSTSKRLSAGLSKLTNGLGLNKSAMRSAVSVGKERQHGKFPFEPPVPLSPHGVRRELSRDSEREREREREERERLKKPPLSPPLSPGRGHNASLSTSSTTSSTQTGVSVGHRSGKKGRSLDLGLGLAWAPTKVREDAVMPESSFGRSLSASRREQQGKEVAEVFRTALDEDGYRSFKKYVHRFDAHEIPFDGPTGIVTRVERLLRKAQHIPEDTRQELLDNFIKLILQSA